MTPDTIITIGQQALMVLLLVSAPLLLVALAVGLLVSIFQAATQINEMTLSLSVVKGWFGFKQGGVEAPFNKGAVAKMFSKYPTWKDKVNAALENESNFIKG